METITFKELIDRINCNNAPAKVKYEGKYFEFVARNIFYAKYISIPFDAKNPIYLLDKIIDINEKIDVCDRVDDLIIRIEQIETALKKENADDIIKETNKTI